jgi:hypothetical protein
MGAIHAREYTTAETALRFGPVPAGTAVTLTATANDTRYNSGGYGTEATQNIAAARYSVSWAAGATLVPMTRHPVAPARPGHA